MPLPLHKLSAVFKYEMPIASLPPFLYQVHFELAKEKRGLGETGNELIETVRRRALGARVPLDDLAMSMTGLELAEMHARSVHMTAAEKERTEAGV